MDPQPDELRLTTAENWARTLRFTPGRWVAPASEAEVQAALARRDGLRVRVAGGRHSWSPLAVTEGLELQLDGLAGVTRAADDVVAVRAGMRLWALNEALDGMGLAMPVLGSIAEQSVAGALATGTHGSSLTHGNLASTVCGMRIVRADGEVVELREGDPLLAAARVSLGALGVVTEVRLRVFPAFQLVEEREPMRLDRVCADLPTIARSAEYVKLWWLPHTDHVQVFRYHRAGPGQLPAPVRGPWARWLDERVLNGLVFPGVLALGVAVGGMVPIINRLVRLAHFQPGRSLGRSFEQLVIAMPPRHRETEVALPLERAGAALAAVGEHIHRHRAPVNFVQELRFAPADDAWLSGAYGRETCHFGAYMAGSARSLAVGRYFEALWGLLDSPDVRPHWGKELPPWPRVLDRFPRGGDFRRLVGEWDPGGALRNPAMDAILGG